MTAKVRPEMLEKQLIQYIREYDQLMSDLTIVKGLNLPDCYIAAGYIRNYIWDRIHGFPNRDKHNDIDIVYYDFNHQTESRDIELENRLIAHTGNEKWSVKNQARMHTKNGNSPYASIDDALSKWPETATAVGARIDENNKIQIICPYGLEDLFEMTVRRSPLFNDQNYYINRVNNKDWQKQWPLLSIIE
jgi:hypothetical protein